MLAKIAELIRGHKLALINAALMAALMVAPLVAFPLLTADTYQGINIANHGIDELWYLSRAREALDGHNLGNAILAEGKDAADPFFSYFEYAVFTPLRAIGLAGVNVSTVYAILNAAGVFVLLLLIYWFVFQLSGNKILANLNALLIIGGYAIVAPSSFLSINVYSRAVMPYVPSLLTFLHLNLLLRALRARSWQYGVAAGTVLGSLFYLYFYAWSFILVIIVFLVLLCAIKKEYAYIKYLFFIGGVGLLLGLYNIFNILTARTGEFARQLSYFHWIDYTRAPAFNIIGAVALFLMFLVWPRIKRDRNLFIFLAFILAGWVVLNQQIITGTLLQSEHYYDFFVVPTALIVCTYIIWMLIQRPAQRRLVIAGIVIFAYFNTAAGQYRALRTSYEDKQYRQQYRPILDYLNQEADQGVVLSADDVNAYLTTIYTPHDIFWAHSFLIVNVPTERRLRDTLFVYLYLNSQSRSDIDSYLRAPDNQASFYRVIYQTLEGYSSGLEYYDYYKKSAAQDPLILAQRERLLASLADEYRRITKNSDGIKQLIKQYGISYIIWDKNQYPEWDLSFLNLTEAVFADGIFLYKVNL